MGFSQVTLGFNGPSWQVEAGEAWLRWRDALNSDAGHLAVSNGRRLRVVQ